MLKTVDMQRYVHPEPQRWPEILQRPALDTRRLEASVNEILEAVKREGDAAVLRYTEKFDGVRLRGLRVEAAEVEAAAQALTPELRDAIRTAYANIERFHARQRTDETVVETMPGVHCWRRDVAIEKVGLYVPGGTAPLFSTVLMLGLPAKLAGCREIVLSSPPREDGSLHPAIVYTAGLIGITHLVKAGGVQAVGAMAYGTESVPAVYKIFGPGNQYVTAAKQMVSREGVAIDMPAGPSEVLVCADHTADPAFVAADLLSQAEHGPDSQVVLVAFSEDLLEAVQRAITEQLRQLPRRDIAAKALENSAAVVMPNRAEALRLINSYAPEHLILSVEAVDDFARGILNAGSVFMGNYTPESVGDYASGTNHTLPTNGFARVYSGVSLDSFVKKITFQQLSPEGLRQIGPAVEHMADAEALTAHQRAVRIRLDRLSGSG